MTSIEHQLKQRGWAEEEGGIDEATLLGFADSLGTPIASNSGELVKRLTPKHQGLATEHTFSGSYGNKAFPLHTDTAFWPLPARYVIFVSTGPSSTGTLVAPFERLLARLPRKQIAQAEQSVWLIPPPFGNMYCSLQFRSGRSFGWRYDAHCMRPANGAAHAIHDALTEIEKELAAERCIWTKGKVLVLDNWVAIHGREAVPSMDCHRELLRVYVNQ